MGRANIAETGGLYIPKFVVYILTLLGIINEAISNFCSFIFGLFYYIELEEASSHIQENHSPALFEAPLSAVLLREFLPAVKFCDVACSNGGSGDECAVCLNEFEGNEEVRCLKNCEHLFHRGCIDRWMEEEGKTCPLCRKPLVPVESRLDYDNQLREAFWADYSLIDED